MYRQLPLIETKLDALDELADVRMTLDGLSTLTFALSKCDLHEPEALKLVSCLLDYCTLTANEIVRHVDERAAERRHR